MEIYRVTLGIHRILRQKVRLLTSLVCSIFLHLGSRPTPCSPISSVPGRTPRWCKNWTITCIIHQWHVLPKCLGISKFKNNIYVWFLCLTLGKNLEIDSQHRKMFNGYFFWCSKKINEQKDPCFRGKSKSCCSASGTPMLRTSSSKQRGVSQLMSFTRPTWKTAAASTRASAPCPKLNRKSWRRNCSCHKSFTDFLSLPVTSGRYFG